MFTLCMYHYVGNFQLYNFYLEHFPQKLYSEKISTGNRLGPLFKIMKIRNKIFFLLCLNHSFNSMIDFEGSRPQSQDFEKSDFQMVPSFDTTFFVINRTEIRI